MAKKQPVIFAVWDGEDDLYIDVKHCAIDFLCLCIDGVSLRIEDGRHGKTYIKVSDAIAWHRKELKETRGMSGSPPALEALEAAMEKHRTGKTKFNGE